MQEARATTVTVKTLEDSLDFIDKAIDASDAEEKRRKAEGQKKAERSYVMAERSMRRMSIRRLLPYPVTECYICRGQDPSCPHRRNPNRR